MWFGDRAARNYNVAMAAAELLILSSPRKEMMSFSAEASTALIGGVLALCPQSSPPKNLFPGPGLSITLKSPRLPASSPSPSWLHLLPLPSLAPAQRLSSPVSRSCVLPYPSWASLLLPTVSPPRESSAHVHSPPASFNPNEPQLLVL